MFRWLCSLLKGFSYELDLYPAHRRMKPIRIRFYTPDDFQACRKLYTLNEPGRFPAGVLPEFEESLQSGRVLFLLAEKDGIVCGCGGIDISSERNSQATLSYGLVHPQWHGQGIGTTLLLARLALLPRNFWTAIMLPVQASEGFYRRFNFREFGRYHHPVGGPMPLYFVHVYRKAPDRCAALLAKAGVKLDVGEVSIPRRPLSVAQSCAL
jgi:GNAT superfamily N-acetyltransferase